MAPTDLKSEKYYRTICGKFITYLKYCSIIKSVDENIIYLVCEKVIYFKEKESYYSKNVIIQATVNNNEILTPIFPIFKKLFYKAIRRCNETRRIEGRKML